MSRRNQILAVDASGELTTYLLNQTPFLLNALPQSEPFSDVPSWFPKTSAGFELHQSANGDMTILFNSETRRLYAKSKGHGFKPGAPEAEAPTIPQANRSAGRLPDASPPTSTGF